jgi:WD40 repeat protein
VGFKRRGSGDDPEDDPGYFAVLRELRAGRRRGVDRAARAVEEVRARPETLVEIGWRNASDPGFVRALYDQVAGFDPAIELAVARLDAREGIAWLGLRIAGLAPIAPLVASMLETGDPYPAIQLFVDAPEQFGRPLPGLRAVAASGDHWSRAALVALAASPHPGDRRWALERIDQLDPGDGDAAAIRAAAAEAGETRLDRWLLEALGDPARDRRREALAAIECGEPRHLSRRVPTGRAAIIRAIGARRIAAAVAPLADLLWSFDALEACEALAAIGAPAAIEPLERFVDSLGGERQAYAPHAIFAENALAALGRPRSVDRAREILDEVVPRRFGYLEDELYRVQAAAMSALVDRGGGADRRRVAGFLDTPLRVLREQALRAHGALGEPPPPLSVYDPERVSRSDEATLVDALGDPGAIAKASIVEALLARGSVDARRRAIDWARRRLESRVNTWIDEPYDAIPDCDELIAALADLEGDDRALLEGTSSGWIRALVLGEGEMPYPVEPSEIAAGVEVHVERFDRLPFVFGAHVNGLAVTCDGLRMALVGDSFCKILDARTGAFIAQLDPGWRWGYDCAFTPDGRRLVTCFHGGHVEIYDGETGARLRELVGHGGVPDGVKRLAVSPDGQTVVSAGQDRQVIGFDVESGERLWVEASDAGSCEAVAFAPDGAAVIAAHVATGAGQSNYLTVHEPRTGDARRVETPASIWAIAFSPDGDSIALGGAGARVLLCDRDLEIRRELGLARVTRLAFSADGKQLVGCSTDGVVKRWQLDEPDGGGEIMLEAGAPLWALVLTPSGQIWTIGTAGVLHRTGAAPIRGDTHAAQITGIELLGDALVTGSWDGRVIEWPRGGGVGRERLAVEGRVNRLAADAGRVYAATTAGLYAVDRSGAERLAAGEHDEIAVAGERLARSAGRALEICRLPTVEVEAAVRVGSGDVSAVCPFAGGFLAGTEEGEVSFVAGGERRWTAVDHGHDRLDHGAPHKDICGLAAISGGFASSGNDNTARLYASDGGEPLLLRRLHVDAGIFNKLALSPDGRLLAIPAGAALWIHGIDSAAPLACLRSLEHFENEELTVARFTSDAALVVGTENGHLFAVRFVPRPAADNP